MIYSFFQICGRIILGENMDTKFWIAQFIGLIAFCILGCSYYKKTKRDILLLQMMAYIAFILHYQLLGGITGSVCNLLALVSFIIIYLFDIFKKNKKILVGILVPILIVISFLTFENIYSIFPIIGSVVAVFSFITDKEDLIRKFGIVAVICWLIYAIVYNSYVSIIFEFVTLIVVTIAYFKRRKK